MNPKNDSGHAVVVTAGAVWLGVALLLGATGAVATLRPPMPQVVLFALAALALLAGVFVPVIRHWAMTTDLRVVPAFHLVRFVGAYFLILYGRGELPYAFAVPGGIGDIVVAVTALGLLAAGSPERPGLRPFYLAWNVLGLIDILGVVFTAAVQAATAPGSMAPLLVLPLSLLPTFVVPLILASHVLVFVRLLRPSGAEADGRLAVGGA